MVLVRGDGLGSGEFVEVLDRQLTGFPDIGRGAGALSGGYRGGPEFWQTGRAGEAQARVGLLIVS
ncbi:hypothetical protein HYG77_34225 (plasmid) [Rhodococcus sp. ZPP]|uniref:hypothetical protein n=1 Tax=Rhodococcus sp. ZPP TaxID=2749906 RepID=UPI001AD86530|nr:hypothetical protein [Rhodococcus sp. ZPP]QTJ70566.1 hypothetical protein HYG77_34225 [Rhodococcus sp. ZPP]